jgi:hypothetical protein
MMTTLNVLYLAGAIAAFVIFAVALAYVSRR